MKFKKYLVTNPSEGSISIAGRNHVEIPGHCKNLEIAFPEANAGETVSGLKRRYPRLTFQEVKTASVASASASSPVKKASSASSAVKTEAKSESKTASQDAETARKE